MIYTVTFNPSLDYCITIPNCKGGALNRTTSEMVRVGGKGINVSLALTDMNVENMAMGFLAGFTGDQIHKVLTGIGCKTDFIKVPDGFSRINIKLFGDAKTRMNGMGPVIPKQQQEQLVERLNRRLKPGDTLVLAGNVPASMPEDIYEQILNNIDTNKIQVVLNVSGNLMRRALPYRPFLVKPDLEEMSELFECRLITDEDIIGCAKHLQEEGARNVLFSTGIDGAILVTADGQIFTAPASPFENDASVIGSDDFMIAGFIAGYTAHGSMVDGFSKCIAASAVTAQKQQQAIRNGIAFENEQ